MLHSVLLIDKRSGVCLFSENYTLDFDSNIFSGFLTAVQRFAEDLKIGSLTNFVTNDKIIVISASERVVASLIIDLEDNADDWFDKAYKIAERFEEMYDLDGFSGNITTFKAFSDELSKILESKEKDFMLEVAKWAKKEFSGELQLNALLMPREDKQTVRVDILLDRGEIDIRKIRDKIATHRFQGLRRDLIFIKVIDGIVGRGEIRDFMENLQNFGQENLEKIEKEIFPYFPKMAVIIGHDFSDTVFDLTDKLYKIMNEKHFIQPKYFTVGPLGRFIPDILNCWVEYWKWREPYPERIFK